MCATPSFVEATYDGVYGGYKFKGRCFMGFDAAGKCASACWTFWTGTKTGAQKRAEAVSAGVSAAFSVMKSVKNRWERNFRKAGGLKQLGAQCEGWGTGGTSSGTSNYFSQRNISKRTAVANHNQRIAYAQLRRDGKY